MRISRQREEDSPQPKFEKKPFKGLLVGDPREGGDSFSVLFIKTLCCAIGAGILFAMAPSWEGWEFGDRTPFTTAGKALWIGTVLFTGGTIFNIGAMLIKAFRT